MKTALIPNESHASFMDIDFKALNSKGYRYFIFDVDNTLVHLNKSELQEDLIRHIADLREKNYIHDMCLVSNTFYGKKRKKRLEIIADQLRAHFVSAAGFYSKPHRLPFERAMEKMGALPEETVVVGDQIFTDIKGGNKLGVYTIYVFPLGRDHWITFFRRWWERVLKRGN